MSRLLINIREVAYKRRVVIDSATSSYRSTGLETPVELSSVVFEPGLDDVGIWARDQDEEPDARLAGHEHVVLSTIAEDRQKSFVDEIEMVGLGA